MTTPENKRNTGIAHTRLSTADFIRIVCRQHPEFTQKEVRKVLNATLETLGDQIALGYCVQFYRFGNFTVKRYGSTRIPQGGKDTIIHPRTLPAFIPSTGLRNKVMLTDYSSDDEQKIKELRDRYAI